MTAYDPWLLPEGVEEALPARAWRLEKLRRRLLDLFWAWGYDFIMPPLVEYLDSLLTGTGHELDLQTFKLTDQLSGRLLGLRSDITPQAARVDTNRLAGTGSRPRRLCYIGDVLRTRPDGVGGSRSPLQVGAELFGHAGTEADLEVLRLMLATLEAANAGAVHLDLGHAGLVRSIVDSARLTPVRQQTLFEILQRKAVPELTDFIRNQRLDEVVSHDLRTLLELNGSADVVGDARARLHCSNQAVEEALTALQTMAAQAQAQYPDLPVHVDLAELRGYRYHTGLLFAALVPSHGRAVARGGRYDGVGEAFGEARPATGFSADLHELVDLDRKQACRATTITAPAGDQPALLTAITRLRERGERVVQLMPDQAVEQTFGPQLVKRGAQWVVQGQ